MGGIFRAMSKIVRILYRKLHDIFRFAGPASLRVGKAGFFVHDRLNGAGFLMSALFHMLASCRQFVEQETFLYAVRAAVVALRTDIVHVRGEKFRRRVFLKCIAERGIVGPR